jgi:hypothetical protein
VPPDVPDPPEPAGVLEPLGGAGRCPPGSALFFLDGRAEPLTERHTVVFRPGPGGALGPVLCLDGRPLAGDVGLVVRIGKC